MDNTLINFLENLEKDNLIDNTLVMLYADHGHHEHPLLATSFAIDVLQPKMELWLPSFFINVPKKFADENPEMMKNLKIN